MNNFESNRNGWKDDNSKCNCYDKKCDICYNKKEQPCYCEPKDDKCDDYKKCDCGYEKKDDKCKDDKHDKKETCCCKDSMKKALELLSCPTINPYVNFSKFAFIGDSFLVGTQLSPTLTNGDNIQVPDSTFNGFESCSCSSVRLAPTTSIFYPTPDTESLQLTVNHVSLCDTEAIAFTYNTTAITTNEFEANLIALLDDSREKCFVKCDECCCNESVFNSIYNSFSSSVVSLTGGWLALENAKVLGRVGNVLVLSNTSTTDKLIYFVCLDSIGFLNY